jgi:hypothetical protein
MSARIKSRGRKRPRLAEADRVWLMLPPGSACQLEYAVDRMAQRLPSRDYAWEVGEYSLSD